VWGLQMLVSKNLRKRIEARSQATAMRNGTAWVVGNEGGAPTTGERSVMTSPALGRRYRRWQPLAIGTAEEEE
jgi:hypothetical protein